MGIFRVLVCSIELQAGSRLAYALNNPWYDIILLTVSTTGSTAVREMLLGLRDFLLEFSPLQAARQLSH